MARAFAQETSLREVGDPQSCEYWRYCALSRSVVQLLRRQPPHLPAGYGSLTDYLGRHLPQSAGRPGIPDLLQRLLRQVRLRSLRLSQHRRRQARVFQCQQQYRAVVFRRRTHELPLHGGRWSWVSLPNESSGPGFRDMPAAGHARRRGRICRKPAHQLPALLQRLPPAFRGWQSRPMCPPCTTNSAA